MTEVSSFVRDRGRAFGIATALLVACLALALSPAAFGAQDPVASGTFKFKLSSGFKKQLKSNHVSMKPKKFKVTGGKVDPTTGAGTLNLKGKLTFKKGGKKLVYKKLTAKIGKKGNLKGKAGKVFSLKGGKVTRDGFGAKISKVKVKFLKGAAKKVNKALDLHSLKQGKAGTASTSEQPSKVALVSGTSELIPNLATFGKFAHHCVDPLGTGTTGTTRGVAPIAPATATASPSFVFPIIGGDLAPTGSDGTINGAGGIQINQNILNDNAPAPGSLCNTIAGGTPSQVNQTDLIVDLETKQISAHIVISGTGSAVLDGDKGTAFIGTVNMTGATVTSDPAARTINITGAAAAFNATSAQVLNGTFPCDNNSGLNPGTGGCDPSSTFRFVDGDPIGTISVSGQTQ